MRVNERGFEELVLKAAHDVMKKHAHALTRAAQPYLYRRLLHISA
jgi:hypothetical protein